MMFFLQRQKVNQPIQFLYMHTVSQDFQRKTIQKTSLPMLISLLRKTTSFRYFFSRFLFCSVIFSLISHHLQTLSKTLEKGNLENVPDKEKKYHCAFHSLVILTVFHLGDFFFLTPLY